MNATQQMKLNKWYREFVFSNLGLAHHVNASHGLVKNSCAKLDFLRYLGVKISIIDKFDMYCKLSSSIQIVTKYVKIADWDIYIYINTSDPLTLFVAGLSTVTEPSPLTSTRFASRTECPKGHCGREDTAGRNLCNARNHFLTHDLCTFTLIVFTKMIMPLLTCGMQLTNSGWAIDFPIMFKS